MREARKMRVTLDLGKLYYSLTRVLGIEYLGVRELAILLGVDRRSAGRILAAMAKSGLARRWSRSYYKLAPLEPPKPGEAPVRVEGGPSPKEGHEAVEGGGETLTGDDA